MHFVTDKILSLIIISAVTVNVRVTEVAASNANAK